MTWNGEINIYIYIYIYIIFLHFDLSSTSACQFFYIRCLVHANENNTFLGIRSKSILAISPPQRSCLLVA